MNVANSAPIPTFPETSPKRWSVLVDSIVVGSNQIPVTTGVAGAPGDKAVVLLDSGTSYSFVQISVFYCLPGVDVMRRYAPTEVCKAIYRNVPGATFDSGSGQWIVPCGAEIDMAIQIKFVHIRRSRSQILTRI
jgi:hypothetical protein